MVLATASLTPCSKSQSWAIKLMTAIKIDTYAIYQISWRFNNLLPVFRGLRLMIPDSAGSKINANWIVIAETMLIHSSCVACNGNSFCIMIVKAMISPSAKDVGNRNRMLFLMLS